MPSVSRAASCAAGSAVCASFSPACVLGVTAIAGIGSLAAAVVAGIKADARDLLGGDAEARLTLRPADAAERAFLCGQRPGVRDRDDAGDGAHTRRRSA